MHSQISDGNFEIRKSKFEKDGNTDLSKTLKNFRQKFHNSESLE